MIKVTVPAGEYFVGNPCYAASNDDWDPLLKSCNYFNNPVGEVKGIKILAFSTKYGDGTYLGSNGVEYSVDAGLIGLTPKEYATNYFEEKLNKLGSFVKFDEDIVCTNDEESGTLTFGNIDEEPDSELDR